MVLLANFAATLFLTGLAWSLQFVQLEILEPGQLARHRRLNTRLMVVPMAIEAITAVWLVVSDPAAIPVVALLVWGVIGFATIRYSIASRNKRIAVLKFWNAFRTAGWTARSLLLAALLLESRNAR